MSNMSYEDRHFHRRKRFEQGYRELAAQGAFAKQPTSPTLSAELRIYVAFALATNLVSRAFGWLRILAYLAFMLSIANAALGTIAFAQRHWALDLLSGAYLIRSFAILLKRECTT